MSAEPGVPSGTLGSGGTRRISRTFSRIHSGMGAALLDQGSDGAELSGDAAQGSEDFVVSGRGFGVVGAVVLASAAHAGVEEIAHRFMVLETLQGHRAVGAAGGG